MKIIFKIARAELRTLFYSPIAWFILFVFYITGSAILCYSVEEFANFQEVLLDAQPAWPGFDNGVGRYTTIGLTSKLLGYLYLFIPLLTMGIINRETSNGTIKLLYSSPVTTQEIVWGKYLGIVLFNLILLSIFAFLLFVIYFDVNHAEYKWFLSILLGTFLLVNAYAAIGLFISCLTNYQIIAAVITFTVFFILSQIASLWQQYDLIRDITWFLSMRGKSEPMMEGLITSRDLIYFLLIIGLFIGFALIKLKSTQGSTKWTTQLSRYSMLTMVVIALGYFSARPGYIAYADLTDGKLNTLHPSVQEVLKELDGSPLKVTLYTNLLDVRATKGLPQNRNEYLWGVWEQVIRFYPNIDLNYEYYYDLNEGDSSYYYKYPGKSLEEIVAIESEMLDIRQSIFRKPADIKKEIDLAGENKKLIMQIEYNGKKDFLRTYSDTKVWPDQNHVAASIKRLTRKKDITVAFVNGHYERNPYSYSARDYGNHTSNIELRRTLVNEGVDTDTISLATNNIPAAINLLVVADPRSDYNQEEKNKIIEYIDKGGNAIIYAEPGKQFILEAILKTIGVHPDNGIIVSPNDHEMPHIFINKLNRTGNFLAKEKVMQLYQDRGLAGGYVENEGVLNLSYENINGFKIEPVITQPANNKTWIENGILVVDSAAPTYAPAEGDVKKGEYAIALKLTRMINGREQRIIVAGDADFMSHRRMGGYKIDLALYSWTLYNEYPFYVNYPMAPDRYLKLTVEKAQVQTYVLVYLISGLLLLTGIILLVRRKRK